ncbi:MAG: DUF6046 domain-containing protein [Bacteroidota bacterium]|nr:DUF6046 domain-containing protein [Bacteroidota bacterium]
MPDFQEIEKHIPAQTNPIVIKSAPINNIIRTYNIAHLGSVKPTEQNPYKGKVPSNQPDKSKLPLSPLGTPVMQDITFESVTYTDFITKQTITTKSLKLINILLTVSQAKKIITTEIQGRNGTVKEYIGMDDYEIQINGILTGTNGNHPADQIISLQQMLTARVTTPVTCDYLLNLGIQNIVVKDFTYQQDAGGYSTQNFSITCLSDEYVNLLIS